MIDVQWEKAKHVTEHPHPGGFLLRDDKDAVWIGGTSPPRDFETLQRQIHMEALHA